MHDDAKWIVDQFVCSSWHNWARFLFGHLICIFMSLYFGLSWSLSRREHQQWRTSMRCSVCGSRQSVHSPTRAWTSLGRPWRSATRLKGWALITGDQLCVLFHFKFGWPTLSLSMGQIPDYRLSFISISWRSQTTSLIFTPTAWGRWRYVPMWTYWSWRTCSECIPFTTRLLSQQSRSTWASTTIPWLMTARSCKLTLVRAR